MLNCLPSLSVRETQKKARYHLCNGYFPLAATTSINWVNGKCRTFPASKASVPPRASPSWQHWNWVNAASYRNVRSVPPSALPKTFTKSFTRFFATWHTKNSGFYSLTRLPASSTNPASAAAASTRLLPTYAASCAKP